jgi:flavin reductase (DIM6/NTAB) family NADH-FMN oxidoreductase RutF
MPLSSIRRAAAQFAPEDFKEAMSRVSYTVSVVSTYSSDRFYGKTINTLAPVSAEDSSILISLYRESSITQKIMQSGEFCVSVLGEDQKGIAEDFAKSTELSNPFERWKWGRMESGAPYFEGAVACFDCTLVNAIQHASHVILIGHITAIVDADIMPLLHHRRAYRPCANSIIQ